MTELLENPHLHAFVVFNAIPPTAEGSDPIVYWFYSQQETDANFKLNITGLLITFISFCEKWGTPDVCDYVDTKDHEIGLLQLCGPVWMGVSLESTGTNKRTLLNSILKYSKLMFSHFFVPLPEPGTNQPDPPLDEVTRNIKKAFEYIAGSIDWNCLDVTYLFNSYHMQPIRKIEKNLVEKSQADTNKELDDICDRILSHEPKIFDNIVILYSRHTVIKSTMKDPNVTRALSFAMRKKFKFMYLHKPVCVKEFSWLIGLYEDENGLTAIYQQPIYYDGSIHCFVAFKYHKFKIVLTIRDIDLTESIFKEMPGRLKELRSFLKQCYPQKVPPSYFSYTRAINDFTNHQLVCVSDKFMPIDHLSVHEAWIMLHESSKSFAKNAVIVIPGNNEFKLMCDHKEVESDRTVVKKEERLVALQKNLPGIAEYVKHCKIIGNLTLEEEKPTKLCII